MTAASRSGAADCWCFVTAVPDEVVAKVPAALRGIACICEQCANGRGSHGELGSTAKAAKA